MTHWSCGDDVGSADHAAQGKLISLYW